MPQSDVELKDAEATKKSGKLVRFLGEESMLVGQRWEESRVENRRETGPSISSVEMAVTAHENVSECQLNVEETSTEGPAEVGMPEMVMDTL